MTPRHVLGIVLSCFILFGLVSTALAAGPVESRDREMLRVADPANSGVLISTGPVARYKAGAATDTFYLYGGPGTVEGKFQDANGIVPDFQGWTSVDRTETPVFWQLSTFCASNLDGDGSSGGAGDGPGNIAYWAGQTAEQQPGWVGGAGYGNSWNIILEWRATVDESSGPVAQTVGFTFAFNADTEPGYDFFLVEYDSANVTKTVTSSDGWNTDPQPPGTQFPADVPIYHALEYNGGDYSGPNHDEIVLRFRVTSDGAWSDEDGFADSECGAAQVDDITVTYDDGTQTVVNFSDFDIVNGGWTPAIAPYFGDFADVYPKASDTDPCRENKTPVVAFIDAGQCPRNAFNNNGNPPCDSTGGETSPNYTYGPGGYVVNYSGGLTGPVIDRLIHNQVWSPEIEWDLPGTEDDGPDFVGARIGFDVWSHMDINSGIYYNWAVRSQDAQGTWGPWEDRTFFYGFGTEAWLRNTPIVTDLLVVDPVLIQVSLGVFDASNLFQFPGNDATSSPYYDNVQVLKYRVGGPAIVTRIIEQFQDSFPQSGETDFSTLAGRQNSDIRLDMAWDVNTGNANTAGDSVIVNVTAVLAGTAVSQVGLNWILEANPLFDDVRDNVPVGATVDVGGAGNGWDQYTGTVAGQISTVNGLPQPGRYFFDLPDQGFFNPGDRLRYYIWATDDGGRTSTLPVDTSNWASGERYDRTFMVRGLPTVTGTPGSLVTPTMLVVNDSPTVDHVYEQSFATNGWADGSDYDSYLVKGATSGVSNGIGSAGVHGATAAQLAPYESMFYFGGTSSGFLLSDGTNSGLNDKSDDLGVVSAWMDQDADRNLAMFGDNIASAISTASPGPGVSFVTNQLGVELFDSYVSDDLDGQTTPLVAANSGCFIVDYVAFGGCLQLNRFDNIGPLSGATTAHDFLDPGGVPYAGPGRSASVFYDRLDGNNNRKVSVTFPYGLNSIRDSVDPDGSHLAQRAFLIIELANCLFGVPTFAVPTPADPIARPYLAARAVPSPFNPATVFQLTLGRTSYTEARVYNLRGELVHTLHVGELDAGPHALPWDGRDDNGAAVASGVYVLRATADGLSVTEKAVLIK